MELGEILKGIFSNFMKGEEFYSKTGKVKNIDETERTCDVEPVDGSAEIFGVRLQASIKSNAGVVLIPKDGSFVTVTFMNKDTGYISQTTEVAKVIGKLEDDGEFDFTVGNSTLKVTKDEITFNGGQLNGLVILDKIVTKLNDHETAINTIASKFDSHVHPLTFGPPTTTGATSATASTSGVSLASTTNSDLENTKIKQ